MENVKCRPESIPAGCECICMVLEHRLQILLDDERHRRITIAARERGVSVATVVREAIDRALAVPIERRRAAGARILGRLTSRFDPRTADQWLLESGIVQGIPGVTRALPDAR